MRAALALLVAVAGCGSSPGAPDARIVDAPLATDAAPGSDARVVDARPGTADATPAIDAASAVDAAPSASCQDVRLTYYDVETAGACEVMDVPAALPAIGQQGLTAAVAEPWWGGSRGGARAEACGECWEITTAHATRTVVVTDLCPIEGNPVCAGSFFHFDLAHTAAVPLDYLEAGIVHAQARPVPCPVSGNIFAVIRDANPTFIRFALASPRVPIRQVDVRGGGAGVSATNPWTAMNRDGGAWAAVGDLTRGGTGVQVRITSALGQTLESSVVLALAGPFPRGIDLGVQLDATPAAGPSCPWRVPDPYRDGFGGIDQVRWRYSSWMTVSLDAASASGCRSGTCFATTLGAWGGFTWEYPEDFARAGLSRLVLYARSADAAPIEVKLSGPDGDCAGVTATLGGQYQMVSVDLDAACPGHTRLQRFQVQVMRAAGGSVALDDVTFETVDGSR